MKRRGFAHAVFLLVLLVLMTLFLSAFIWTCFHQPVGMQQPATIRVPSPVLPEPKPATQPLVSLSAEPLVPRVPSLPRFSGQPVVEQIKAEIKPLPPPVHLISLPIIKPIEKVEVPPAPSFAGPPTVKAFVPDPPYMFEPLVLSEEEFDMFYPQSPAIDSTSDDFWADFFVVGQDATIAFEDGFYFLNLFVNDERVGDIEVEFAQEQRLLSTEDLTYYVGTYITKEAYERIFGDGLQYLSLEDLMNRGVDARYDAVEFAVYLNFSIADMPERSVSVTSSSINRREQYGMSGAIVLKPAKFALASSLSLYAMMDYPSDFTQINNQLISLSVSNRASLLGIGLNFYFSLSSKAPVYNPGSWNGFYDFVESNHRLSFGNVGTSLSSVTGASTNFGFTFEKNYAFGTGSAKGNQFEYRIVLVETSTVDISINGETVFSRKFAAGTYRLRDFVFTQGANQIKITITPEAHPDDIQVEYVDMGYDYRLLGKGDTLYGFGFSVPKVKSTSAGALINLPWLDNQYLSYYIDKFTATYYQQTGLTDTFTFTTDLAFSPGVFSGTVNGVLASLVGTSQIQLTLGLDASKHTPSFAGSLSHRMSGRQDGKLGTISATLNHSIPARTATDAYSSVSTLSLSYSGSFTEKIRYTLSGNLIYNTTSANPSWSLSFASGFSPFKGFSLSGSITANGSNTAPLSPTVSAQISGSYSFSPKLSANSSTSIQSGSPFFDVSATSSAGLSWRPTSNDNLNLSISSFKFDDPKNHSVVGSWSHSGNLSSFSLRQQISNSYQNMSTTFTANTSFAYADGAFAIGKAVNESFLLVKPVGELSKSDVSVARSLDSAPSYLPRPLGSALYNNISTNIKNSVVVFSSGATEYSTGSSFVYEITPRSRQSFVAKLDVEPAFTVSGVLLMADASPYIQYSSPVYKVMIDETGGEELIRDDALYLFTDQEGRFILSEVKSGTYLFDLQVKDLWYAVRFIIPEIESQKLGLDRVLLLEDFWVADPAFEQRIVVTDVFTGEQVEEEEDVFGTELAVGYDAEVTLDVVDRISEETFWTIIFPPFDESDFSFEMFDESYVTDADFQFAESLFDEMVAGSEQDATAQQVFTAAP